MNASSKSTVWEAVARTWDPQLEAAEVRKLRRESGMPEEATSMESHSGQVGGTVGSMEMDARKMVNSRKVVMVSMEDHISRITKPMEV